MRRAVLASSEEQDDHGTVPSRKGGQGATKARRDGLEQNGHALHRVTRRQPGHGNGQRQTQRRAVLEKAHNETTQEIGG